MLTDTGFHRWSNSQRLVDTAEVVMHEVQSNCVAVIFKFLTESVREPRVDPSGPSLDPTPG